MPQRLRKFIGGVVMIAFVTVYALMVMTLAQIHAVRHAAWYVQTVFYAVAGTAWVLPLMPLITWMQKPDRR